MMTPPLSISARPTLTRKASDVKGDLIRSWGCSRGSSFPFQIWITRLPRRRVGDRGPGRSRPVARAPAHTRRRSRGPSRGPRPAPAGDGDAERRRCRPGRGANSPPGETRTPFSRAAAARARPGTPSGSSTQRTQPPSGRSQRVPTGKLLADDPVREGEPRPQPRAASSTRCRSYSPRARKRFSAACRTGGEVSSPIRFSAARRWTNSCGPEIHPTRTPGKSALEIVPRWTTCAGARAASGGGSSPSTKRSASKASSTTRTPAATAAPTSSAPPRGGREEPRRVLEVGDRVEELRALGERARERRRRSALPRRAECRAAGPDGPGGERGRRQ